MAKRDKSADAKPDLTTVGETTVVENETTLVDTEAELNSLQERLRVAEQSASQWRSEAELQMKNAENAKADLKDATDRGVKLAKELESALDKGVTMANKALREHVRFQGTLKDAAEQHFQKRNSEWDAFTVIYDYSAPV